MNQHKKASRTRETIQNPETAKKRPISTVLIGCFAAMGYVSFAHADAASDLRDEVVAQKARLEALEKKLEVVTQEAATAKEAAKAAQQRVAAPPSNADTSGISMPQSLTIYGIADAGIEYGDYGQGKKVRVQSGLGSASRLGFKGERDFGSDLSAYFQLEMGVSFDNGQNTGHSSNISDPGPTTSSSPAPNTTGVAVFSRNTFVGMKSKKYGDIRFGRDYMPMYSITTVSDPFSIGGATAYRLWSGSAASRFDNGVFYKTPKWNGLTANIAYSAGMENNNSADVGVVSGYQNDKGPKNEGKGSSGSLSWENGPLFLGTGYMRFHRTGDVTGGQTENTIRSAWNLSATYDLKFMKIYGQFLNSHDTKPGLAVQRTLDRRVYWAGVSVPFGGVHTVRAVYGHLDDRLSTDRDSDHYGVGYEYALDKQTDLYVYYAQVSNKNGGQNSLCAGGTCQGYDKDTNLPVNFTPKSLMLGGRYRF